MSELCHAPAKVNFGLRIVGVRPDGYHLLESLFVPLDLHDTLEIELVDASAGGDRAPEIALDLVGAPGAPPVDGLPRGEGNLAVKAAATWLAAARLTGRVRISLEKAIPSAAGLGGGSSDAAAVLGALQRLGPAPLPQGELARIALGLGADVPFFLDARPTWVRGVGERLELVKGWPKRVLLLANPGISLATAEVYAAFDALSPSLTPARPGPTMRAISGSRNHPSAAEADLDGLMRNDLEPAAVRLCPPVGRLRDQLRRTSARAVGMSGSGATVFGVFGSRGDAQAAGEALAIEPPAWICVVEASGS